VNDLKRKNDQTTLCDFYSVVIDKKISVGQAIAIYRADKNIPPGFLNRIGLISESAFKWDMSAATC